MLALVAIVAVVTMRIEIDEHREFWFALFDAGHYPLIAALTLLLHGLVGHRVEAAMGDGRRGRWGSAFFVGSVAVLAAFAIEAVQPLIGRTASSIDLINGLAGAVMAATGLGLWRAERTWPPKAIHTLVAVGLMLFLLRPAITQARAVRWRDSHFPVLGRFEDPIERRLWQALPGRSDVATSVAIRDDYAKSGEGSLRVVTAGGAWPGVRFNADRQDWSAYGRLVVDVYNPGEEPFRLNVRVDDDGDTTTFGGRFNGRRELAPGWNRLEVPIASIAEGPSERTLDLTTIRALYLFTARDDGPRTFFVDDVRLE